MDFYVSTTIPLNTMGKSKMPPPTMDEYVKSLQFLSTFTSFVKNDKAVGSDDWKAMIRMAANYLGEPVPASCKKK